MALIPLPHVTSLSVVMPYFNEEENIEDSLRGALRYLDHRFGNFEVIAVDDHSTDRTLEIARRIQAAEPRVRVIALDRNTKFAGALKKGFEAAEKEFVFYTDGDCPIEWEDVDRGLIELKRFDVVVGYRITRDNEGLLRRLYTRCYRATLRFVLGIDFRDVNFSFKLFPRSILRKIDIESAGSFIDAEILFKLAVGGYSIREIPVMYHSRIKGKSTLASPGIIVKILRELLTFRLTHGRCRRLPIASARQHEIPDIAHR